MGARKPMASLFRHYWKYMSDQGWCDGWGGAECLRMWREWRRAGYPRDVRTFIVRRANIGAALRPIKYPIDRIG
jgi:hypothetical protein